MTYCVAVQVNDGLVFASDTRTSAGVDDVRTYGKMHVFEVPAERVLIVLSAGNLATTHAILAQLRRDFDHPGTPLSLRTAPSMYDVAEYLGAASTRAQKDPAAQSQYTGVDLRVTLILGGQIRGAAPALYLIYPEGNCISSSPETPYLQLGESKYGKPILDRIIRSDVSLEDAARCALVSLDSTMKSNLSVGPPIDLAIVRRDECAITHKVRFDLDNPYFAQLREAWGRHIAEALRSLPKFDWEQAPG
jgi:putative proteasome-type protease